MLPTKLWILDVESQDLRNLTPVTSLDITDGATANLHDEGLFSTRIFGLVGTEARERNFSYIHIKVRVLHPKIYRDLMALKGIYKEILSGTTHAVFDKQQGDFIASTSDEAETGYSFFMRHFPDLQLRRTKSPARNDRVKFVEKWRHKATVENIVVIPAALRDLEYDLETGQTSKNEINDLYYRLLSISNTIVKTRDMESPVYDVARNALTLTFYELYKMIEGIISGKSGFMNDKWSGRRVFNGTRNVLSAQDPCGESLEAPNCPSFDSTVFGIYQVAVGLAPLTIHLIRNTYLSDVFGANELQVPLIDVKTLQREWVDLSPEARDIWTTKDGTRGLINSMVDLEARHRPILVDGRYLALVYVGPDMTFKVFYDIRELPPGFDRKHVHPISLIELVYLSGYRLWHKRFADVVRYPITGDESTYPSRIYVKTTSKGEVRRELDSRWLVDEDPEAVALEFPIRTLNTFMDSQAPHPTRLAGMGAD